jgi:anti-anti-sigma regulatory factor
LCRFFSRGILSNDDRHDAKGGVFCHTIQQRLPVEITTRNAGDILVADLSGSLDTQTSGQASEEMARLIAQASSGLKEIEAKDGKMKICQPNGVVKEVLDISGFASFLGIHDDETDALAAFSG